MRYEDIDDFDGVYPDHDDELDLGEEYVDLYVEFHLDQLSGLTPPEIPDSDDDEEFI